MKLSEESIFLQQPQQPIGAQVLRKILSAIGEPPKSVYPPGQDSYLMLEAIAVVPVEGKEVLDMGTGSGILGLSCAMRGAHVTLTDIDELAIQHSLNAANVLGLKVETKQSDLFSNVNGRFDFVLFNPPYLPSETVEDWTIDGGPTGTTLTKRFLHELPGHLKKDGAAFLLVSSLNDPPSILREYPQFRFSQMATRSLFFEELQVLRARFRDDFAR